MRKNLKFPRPNSVCMLSDATDPDLLPPLHPHWKLLCCSPEVMTARTCVLCVSSRYIWYCCLQLQYWAVLWLHSYPAHSPPTVLFLFSVSFTKSSVFALEVRWCLLHHICYLPPHFPNRLSQAAGTTLCSFAYLANPRSTSWEHIPKVLNLQTCIFAATWKISFKHFDSSCCSRSIQHSTIGSQLSMADPRPSHCMTSNPNTSKAKDTKRRYGNPWDSNRLSTSCTNFHCSILLPLERGRKGISQPFHNWHTALLDIWRSS